jgi:iron-only hydrogenase group A
VRTASRRARESRRLTVELLLAAHGGDCPSCARNGACDLQRLAESLGIRELRFPLPHRETPPDRSTPALERDMRKCILCRRCVAVCAEIQGVGILAPCGRGLATEIVPGGETELANTLCVQCGQCSLVCPVGAIAERDDVPRVWAALDDPAKTVIVQTAPAIRAALGECFGLPPGSRVTGRMVTALRRLGFNAVFDTDFGADLTIMEEGSELLERLRRTLAGGEPAALPLFTSCSPGWINWLEQYAPELIPNLSTCKSPQQMFGAIAKTWYAQKTGVKPENLVVVSIMPCTAKKYECVREEMCASGVRDVDIVLTTRELGRMIAEAGIDFLHLPDGPMDAPLGISTGAADVFANTGGVMEAALRTVYELVTGRELPLPKLHVLPVMGLAGVKEAAVTLTGVLPEWSFLEGVTLKVAVAHGLANAREVCAAVRAGNPQGWHFIEIMCCPGGCIGGGGQPRPVDQAVREARIRAIYEEDEGRPLRKSHLNPAVQALYREFLGRPLGPLSHQLLHTHYHDRRPAEPFPPPANIPPPAATNSPR